MSRTKPVQLKQGTITKEEYNNRVNSENVIKGDMPISVTPPRYLCVNGKKIYKNIVKSLPNRFLNNTDEYVVAIIADSLAKMQECQEILKKEGLLVEYTNSAGATNVDQNKAILIYQKYNDIFKKYIGEIGLSPGARGKLAIMVTNEKSEEADPVLKLLGRGKK